jgi:uncharacterized protein YcbK (DUF882 family)
MIDWSRVKYFKKSEFSEPDKMSDLLIYSLDALRNFVNKPITVNSSYRANDAGTHGRGEAVDIVIKGLDVLDQFLIAERTRLFSGIGVYPFWNRPGIHVDVRSLKANEHGARWARDRAGFYVALNSKFLNNIK